MIDFNNKQFEMLEEQFLTNDTSITYANAWNYIPGYEMPQNFQCGGYQNAEKFLKVGQDGYIRLTAVEPGTGVSEEYVDTHDQMTLQSANTYTDEQTAQTLNSARNYTDQNMLVVREEAERLEGLIEALDATKAGLDYITVSPTGSSTNLVNYITIGTTEYKLAGGGGSQIQSDWTQTDTSAVDFIKNKPDLTIYATVSALNNEIQARVQGESSLQDQVRVCATRDELVRQVEVLQLQIDDCYTKSQTYSKSEVYNKTEIDNMIGTIETVLARLTTGTGV